MHGMRFKSFFANGDFCHLLIMHQSFVSTAPPPTGMAGIVTFHFSEP